MEVSEAIMYYGGVMYVHTHVHVHTLYIVLV